MRLSRAILLLSIVLSPSLQCAQKAKSTSPTHERQEPRKALTDTVEEPTDGLQVSLVDQIRSFQWGEPPSKVAGLVAVRAEVIARRRPLFDNQSFAAERSAILRLLPADQLPCFPNVRSINLKIDVPSSAPDFFAVGTTYTFYFTVDCRLYDVFDKHGESVMVDFVNGGPATQPYVPG